MAYQSTKKTKKLIAFLVILSIVLSIVIAILLFVNINQATSRIIKYYEIDSDYQVITYRFNYKYDSFKRMDVSADEMLKQYGEGVFIGDVSHSDVSKFCDDSFYDDQMYIVYSKEGSIIIRLKNDFGEDYYYTNDESLM
jgi:hypothetical protein